MTNTTDLELISQWEKNIDDDESWDLGHALCIQIKPEFKDEVAKVIDLVDDDGTFYADEIVPGFWIDVEHESLEQWALDFHGLKPEWVDDVSVMG